MRKKEERRRGFKKNGNPDCSRNRGSSERSPRRLGAHYAWLPRWIGTSNYLLVRDRVHLGVQVIEGSNLGF